MPRTAPSAPRRSKSWACSRRAGICLMAVDTTAVAGTCVRRARFYPEFNMSSAITKAEREWEGLRQVYREHEFASVHHGDRPDFVLCRQGTDTEFGVEVTELYETEADARAHIHPDYIPQLLSGSRHMHKDDVSVLNVERVQLLDKAGNVKATSLPAIVRELPAAREHTGAIVELLRRKTAQARGYRHGLSHVNLLIVDRIGTQRPGGASYSTNELLVPELKEALVSSPFREVFLVSMDHDWRVYRPLQMLLLLEAFELFLGALEAFEVDAPALEIADVVPLFVHIVNTMGSELRLVQLENDSHCAVYRGCGIQLTPDKVGVLDFADHDLPPPAPTPAALWSAETISAFIQHHASFAVANAFIVGLAIPAVVDGVDTR